MGIFYSCYYQIYENLQVHFNENIKAGKIEAVQLIIKGDLVLNFIFK